jgi:hypothetical protein
MPRISFPQSVIQKVLLDKNPGALIRVEGLYTGDFIGTAKYVGAHGAEFRIERPLCKSENAPQTGEVIWVTYSNHLTMAVETSSQTEERQESDASK